MKQINTQKLQIKLRNKFLKSGVKMVGPETIYFSKDTQIGKNVVIEPYVVFGSKVKIGNNVTIKSFSHLENCRVENKVDILTIGQYLRPTLNHLPIERWVTPEEFETYREIGLKKGFLEVVSGPMVRSSYRAERALEKNNAGL